jgi:hypothetical protein
MKERVNKFVLKIVGQNHRQKVCKLVSGSYVEEYLELLGTLRPRGDILSGYRHSIVVNNVLFSI